MRLARGRASVVRHATFLPIASVGLGRLADAVAFDGSVHRVYVSAGDGEMTAISEERRNVNRVFDRIRTQPGAHALAVDKETHVVFADHAGFRSHLRIAVFAGAAKPAPVERVKP